MIKKKLTTMMVVNILWAYIGVTALIVFAVAEPWSDMFFDWAKMQGAPFWLTEYAEIALVMIIRGLIIVEAIGYFYHRFVEHIGLLTRLSKLIRKNQRSHWIHHMVYYPIGNHYRKKKKYKRSQKSIPWEWLFPGVIGISLIIYFNGISFGSIIIVIVSILYALVVGKTHERFHEIGNPWEKDKYFNWLEDIHKLHHWDQSTNFTICIPLADIFFGTYMSPKKHKKELKIANEDHKIYDSDLINWHYMVQFAQKPKNAVYLSALEQYPEEVARVEAMIEAAKNDQSDQEFYHKMKKIIQLVKV